MCLVLQLAVVQAELERMKMENHRLRNMLDQMHSSYNGLHTHFMNLMQKQKADQDEEEEEKKPGENGGVLVPRQFMDLGLAATNAGDADDHSLSSGRSQDRSPPGHNMEVASRELGSRKINGIVDDEKELGREIEREDSPPAQAVAANKFPRFNPSENVDQAEATMRKARVSVRARSEAPMVHSIYIHHTLRKITIFKDRFLL